MHKDFDGWNEIKKKINNKINFLEIKERQIWWASIGLNIGDEENGSGKTFERPVLIIKKFNNRFCLTIPLTTQKGDSKFYYRLNHNNKDGFLILSQIKVISVKRLKRRINKEIKFKIFKDIKWKLINLIK